MLKDIRFFSESGFWQCKCGKLIPNDRNFCMYCDREKPFNVVS